MTKLLKEYALLLSIITLIIITLFEHTLAGSVGGNLIGLSIIFAVIMYASMSVAHHAEVLAEKFGEPYGTIILTISAVIVEITIIAIMMTQSHNPNLARDTIYSAVILDINGLLGMAAIVGGIKYGEQAYNIDSTNSYLAMIIVAIGISMITPEFIAKEHLHNYMIFLVVVFILLYVVFSRVQLKRHRYFFEYKNEKEVKQPHTENINGIYHAIALAILIILIGLLSEVLSEFMNNTLETFNLPLALGAVAVAVISASPELITAVRAALDNRMQTVVNIAFGASLSTVLLTIPSIIIVMDIISKNINLSLTPLQSTMLGITFFASIISFNDGETNMLEGFIHVVIFIVFCYLLFI